MPLVLVELLSLILSLKSISPSSSRAFVNGKSLLTTKFGNGGDGKVVVIEEVYEGEFFKDKRLQVSIFMSPINVHVTRYAMDGIIKFSKYHPGKFPGSKNRHRCGCDYSRPSSAYKGSH